MHQQLGLPDDAGTVINRYLQLMDHRLPGRLVALYLVGSLALDDYQPGRSDIDFVAVLDGPPTAGELDRLEGVHETLQSETPKPWFDGVYVTRADLTLNPEEITSIAFTHEGTFSRAAGFEVNPSTWLTLRTHPRAVRGSAAPPVWHDAETIRRWNVANLNSYWQGLVEQAKSVPAPARQTDDRRITAAVAWCVPGVARLHYTIRTGDVTSKSGACHYALATFADDWHPLIREALALRRGQQPSPGRRTLRWSEMVGFMEAVIADAYAAAEAE